MGVQVIRDHDATCEGGDFMRVYCQHKRGSPATTEPTGPSQAATAPARNSPS